MCLHPINNKNKFLAILFFSFSFHSDVLQNTEENICCYFYFIATLIVNPYDLYLNLLSNILFVSTIYIQEFKGYIIWLLNGLKPCYQIITSLANTKLWKEFCVLMSHGHDPILTFSRHVPVFLPKRQNLNKCHTLFEIPKNKIKKTYASLICKNPLSRGLIKVERNNWCESELILLLHPSIRLVIITHVSLCQAARGPVINISWQHTHT